jgi:hypothetical protein
MMLNAPKTYNPNPPPLHPDDEHRVAFHMAEFSALKSEIAELVKVASSNLQYALAVSGGITAWLLTTKAPEAGEKLLFPMTAGNLRYAAFVLPLVVSAVFGALASAAYQRIGQKGCYLRDIEDHLRAEGLGWERRFEARPRALGGLYSAAWFGLMMFDLAVASLAFVRPS